MTKRINYSLLLSLIFLIGLSFTSVFVVNSQGNPPKDSATPSGTSPQGVSVSPAATPQPSPAPAPSPKVVGMQGHLELDEIVSVKVENFSEWAATHDPTKLVPFINGRTIRANYPEEIHPDQSRLHFHLQITPETKEVWIDLLGEPDSTHRPVTFSIGLESESPFDSVYGVSNTVPLTVISPVYGLISLLVVLFTLALFLWLVRKTNIIREAGPTPSPGRLRPYNLGRTQMAFWFFLIFVSYIVIWLITDALDTITPSLLGLMGISAGTALSEALIDSGKDTAQGGQMSDLAGEQLALDQTITQLESQQAELNAKATPGPEDITSRDSLNKQLQDTRTRLAQVNQQLESLTPLASDNVSRGFLP
ncbi:MAG TPA: hypothetical protein VIG25_12365, partial [Pyrinomonadaceae bacterium]